MPEARTSHVRDARQVDGTRSNPSITPAQARYKADYDQLTAENPWRDSSVVISKAQDGTLQVRPRGDARPNAAPDAAQPSQQQPDHGPATVGDDGRLAVDDLRLSGEDIRGLLSRHAFEESRKATLPDAPDKYQFTLPADMKLPDGVEWSFSPDHPVQGPLLAQAREFAHSAGLNQDQFSQMLSLHAANQIQEQMVFQRAKAEELAKLGALGGARVDAIRTWVRGLVGDAAPQLLQVLHQAPMASTIEAFEKMMSKYVSGTSGSNPTGGRDPGHNRPGRLSDSEYAKLSYTAKIQYAQQFDQREFNGG